MYHRDGLGSSTHSQLDEASTAKSNNESENKGYSDQALRESPKKNFHSNRRGQ